MKKANILLMFWVLVSANAFAEMSFNSTAPACTFKKFEGGRWTVITAADLPKVTFSDIKPMQGSATHSAVKVNNVWYSAPNECFASSSNGIPPPAPVAKPAEVKAASKDTGFLSNLFADLGLSYVKASGNASGGGSVTTGSTTQTSESYSPKIAFGLNVGKKLKDDWIGYLFFEKMGGTQKGTLVSGANTGNFSLSDSYLNIGVGASKFFGAATASFRPFVGARLGYSSNSTDYTIADFATTSLNGTANASGTGFLLGINAGGEYKLTPSFSLVPMIGYEKLSYSVAKVKTSTSGVYAQDSQVSTSAGGFILVQVAVRYFF